MRLLSFPTAIALVLALATPTSVLAQECPTDIPSSSRERRALAKEWFGRAEAAETANLPIAALKAYQCSLRIVPHAFTAFNLGRLAERTGDLELALEAFNTYLQLAPEAQDKAEIEAKVAGLNTRIAALRNEQSSTVTGPPVITPPVNDPDTGGPATGQPEVRQPAPDATLVQPSPAAGGARRKLHPGVYVASGVAVGALVGGIVLNLQARGKMDDCYALAGEGMTDAADQACKAARPRAFTSYALFGVTAAAAVADAIFIWMSVRTPQAERLTLHLRGDGAAIGTRFRF